MSTPHNPNDDRFPAEGGVTWKQVAAFIGVSVPTARRLVHDGKLSEPARPLGRLALFQADVVRREFADLMTLQAENRQVPPSQKGKKRKPKN